MFQEVDIVFIVMLSNYIEKAADNNPVELTACSVAVHRKGLYRLGTH